MSHRPLPSVVLTGASSGIGRATALARARRGARLVLAARGRGALESVAAECRQAGRTAGSDAVAVTTDVADPAAVASLADTAIALNGGIDAWIDNAGIGAVGDYERTPLEAHRRVVEVDLLGPMHAAHVVLPHFKAQARGLLVHVVSVGAWAAAPYAASYNAGKFGLHGFSRALRAELSAWPAIHVCEVAPTFVDTPGMAHGANYTGRHLRPASSLVAPETVAAEIVSLFDRPRDLVTVGNGFGTARLASAVAPGLSGRITRWLFDATLSRARPSPESSGNLFEPSFGHAVDGGHRPARRAVLALQPRGVRAAGLFAAALAGVAALATVADRR